MEAGVNGTTGCVAQPGTQVSGYSFGIGQDAWGVADSDGVGGRRPEVILVDIQAILEILQQELGAQDMYQDIKIV